MLRLITLAASVAAFVTAGYGYWMAARLTRDPNAAERIVTWGGSAPRAAFTSETAHYRTWMRWGSRAGVVLFMLWAYLTVAR